MSTHKPLYIVQYLSDILLLHLLLVNLLYRISQIIVKIYPKRTHKDNVRSHWSCDIVRETVFIKKDYLPYIEIFSVVKRIAIEIFNEYLLTVVPK